MEREHSLWRAVRWPLLVLLLGLVGVGVATVLDRVYTNELSLTIGAPSLWILVPLGAVWLATAVVVHFVRRRRTG